MLVRAETERNLFNGLGGCRSIFPFHHGRSRGFGQDGITTSNLNFDDRTVGKHCDSQANQSANLFMSQKRRIVRFHGSQNLAWELLRFLGLGIGRDAGDPREQQRQNYERVLPREHRTEIVSRHEWRHLSDRRSESRHT